MSAVLPSFPSRRTGTRSIMLAVALSLLVHGLALWQTRRWIAHPSEEVERLGAHRAPLAVQLVPVPVPVPVPPPRATPPKPEGPSPRAQRKPTPRKPTPRAPKTATPPQPAPPPPVMALDRPAAEPAPQAPPRPGAPADDLSSFIESRRRARAAQAEPPTLAFPGARPHAAPEEDANARANRLAAANLAPGNAAAFGYDPKRGGGIFSIQHVAYDYAEFLFYGWNREAKRNTAQLIEVRKGAQPDIRIAVVRKMIAIIREHEQGDFLWESPRLGRYVTLSARPRDNEGLEAFMLAEFFDEVRRGR